MNDSFKQQRAAQADEEQDLRNDGYTQAFILKMRTVKGKFAHTRVVAFCLSVFLLCLMHPPLNLIFVAVLVFYAIFFRNYPWRTRFGTGRTPSLSGIQLYQEQLKYIRQGIVTASAYLAIAVASIAAVIKIYTAKFDYEAAERKLVGDDLAWYANARQTEWGQRVEAAVMFLFVVGVWLIVASCLRWINIISCRIQLRKRQPVVSVIPSEQDPNAYVTAEKPGHSVFTSKAIAIIGCAVALCVISILVGVVRSNSFGKESHPGQQAVSLNNGTTQSGPGTNATLIHTVARSGFWLGTYGQDPFFRQEGGEERPVTPPEVAVLLDAGGDTYIGKVDKLPNVLPLTEQIWHSEMSSHYLLVEGMDYANWTSGATEHPDGALPMVVRALCRQKVAVSVLEDTMISEDGEIYKDACAVFQNPQNISGGQAAPAASAGTSSSGIAAQGTDTDTRGTDSQVQPAPVQTAHDMQPQPSPIEDQIRQTLQKLATAIQNNDPGGISNCYAEHVGHYFLQHDWTRNAIRSYWVRQLAGGSVRVDVYLIKNLHIDEFSETSARVSLVKELIITAPSGSNEQFINSQMEFTKQADGSWLISSERDLKSPR